MTIRTENMKIALGTAALGLLLVSGSAAAGIASTKHNLGGGITSNTNYVTNTESTGNNSNAEICVFCHTPHGADASAAVPLWNKKLPSSASYSTYADLGTSTLDANVAATGSVSIACLSCHDGTQALDNILNAPGSGGFTDGGGGSVGLAWTWSNPDTLDAAGRLESSSAANLGTDLKNDHPIGVQYAGGPVSTIVTTDVAYGEDIADFKDQDFKTLESNGLAGSNPKVQWWVNTAGGTAGRDKTDMVMYTRAQSEITTNAAVDGALTYQPFVECATCHDPHTENPLFLRIGATGNRNSAVCLACHVK